MSKSLGNSPDPLDLIAKYGADGLRFGLMRIAPSGQDIRFEEKQIEEGRNFATKLWNAARFRQMHGPSEPAPAVENLTLSIYAIEVLARLNETIERDRRLRIANTNSTGSAAALRFFLERLLRLVRRGGQRAKFLATTRRARNLRSLSWISFCPRSCGCSIRSCRHHGGALVVARFWQRTRFNSPILPQAIALNAHIEKTRNARCRDLRNGTGGAKFARRREVPSNKKARFVLRTPTDRCATNCPRLHACSMPTRSRSIAIMKQKLAFQSR